MRKALLQVRKFFWPLLMFCTAFGALAWTASAQQQGVSPYIGPEACIRCHGQLARAWLEVSHSKALMAEDRPPSARGCEACHGPGREHSTKNRKAIISWEGLDREKRNSICMTPDCHPTVTSENWQGGPHDLVRLQCSGCHAVHRVVPNPRLLRVEENTQCLGCHSAVTMKIEAGEHHVVKGFLKCGMCHNPHLKNKDQHLLKMSRAQLCAACHGVGGIKPESHKAKEWPGNHGEIAKPNIAKCTDCHDEESYCTSCHHGVRMPHPEGWLPTGHSMLASFSESSPCFKCHQQRLCFVCHLRESVDERAK